MTKEQFLSQYFINYTASHAAGGVIAFGYLINLTPTEMIMEYAMLAWKEFSTNPATMYMADTSATTDLHLTLEQRIKNSGG